MGMLASEQGMIDNAITISPQTIRGLKYFSGFIAKVQHNFLWDDFMLTRKMMVKQQLEIEVFTAYLSRHHYNKRNKIAELNTKINLFIVFLKDYLQQRTAYRYQLVYNVLLHEEAMFALKQHSERDNSSLTLMRERRITRNLRPALCGAVRQVMMSVPPQRLGECFKDNPPAVLRARRRSYCYWYDPHSQNFRILEIPVMVRRVLEVIDNKRKVRDIEKHFQGKMHRDDVNLVLDQLLQMKMICLN